MRTPQIPFTLPARRLRARFSVHCSALSKLGFLIQQIPSLCQANTDGLHYAGIVVSLLAWIVDSLFVAYCKRRTLVFSELGGVETRPPLPDS